MLDTPSVLILPNCLSVFNMIIMRSFFYGIPESFANRPKSTAPDPSTCCPHLPSAVHLGDGNAGAVSTP
jgi:hypothetical protein